MPPVLSENLSTILEEDIDLSRLSEVTDVEDDENVSKLRRVLFNNFS